MPQLLYVCTGNVCRSPFAERLTRHRFERAGVRDWQVDSSGIGALEGSAMDAPMAAELERRGGSADGFHARQATMDELSAADLVIALTAMHRNWILEESPALLHRTFSLGQIARFVAEDGGELAGPQFLAALREHRSRARRRDDVPDPYRRGPEAAAECARILTGMLDVVLPRLAPGVGNQTG